jgi:hypothetical protein
MTSQVKSADQDTRKGMSLPWANEHDFTMLVIRQQYRDSCDRELIELIHERTK